MYKPVVMSNEDYHAHKNYSSTNIRAHLDCDEKGIASSLPSGKPSSKALIEGSAVHAYLGEPEIFKRDFICKPLDLSLRTKEGRQWVKDNDDKIVLDNDFYDNLPLIADSFYKTPAKDIYTKDGLIERSFFWTDVLGVECKCRPDWISPDYRIIIDLKTTIDANPRKFKQSIVKYRYDIQAQFYRRGIEVCTGVKPEAFYFIAIEKTAPFCVGVYRITEDWLAIGDKEIDEALYRIDSMMQRGHTIGYTPEIMDLSPPQWMLDREDKSKSMNGIPLNEIALF
tara:strand:+ start:453 stop:1298 length:846 start_codon:yes stop_codon:yes gene_type:complete